MCVRSHTHTHTHTHRTHNLEDSPVPHRELRNLTNKLPGRNTRTFAKPFINRACQSCVATFGRLQISVCYLEHLGITEDSTRYMHRNTDTAEGKRGGKRLSKKKGILHLHQGFVGDLPEFSNICSSFFIQQHFCCLRFIRAVGHFQK
jgi:hypothetical protein